ncbi:LacI family DNA-binding transcriptional regulator [Streptomyces sioyaensis]|uniref:LacI family DNA-binding transcriptional regulator n=1 Tax=Streptomyces sioyaensis TaxID=67364 RepID=UPI0037D4A695
MSFLCLTPPETRNVHGAYGAPYRKLRSWDNEGIQALADPCWVPATPPPQWQATMTDVARRAGVSASTVSRALRGLTSVSPEARDRVERAARSYRSSRGVRRVEPRDGQDPQSRGPDSGRAFLVPRRRAVRRGHAAARGGPGPAALLRHEHA